MIGGTVIETIVCSDRVWINCRGNPGTSEARDECAIYVERDDQARLVGNGDQIWWQGGFAMWTPRNAKTPKQGGIAGRDYDRRLKILGYSGAKQPTQYTRR